MAAAYNKFNTFVGDLGLKVHNLNTDAINVGLSNTAPVATNTVWANITEISAGNGYSAGGAAATNTYSQSSGTGTCSGTAVVWTASGGSIGPFRYVVLYNTTPTSPSKPLIAWWDYGSSITLTAGQTFTVQFNSSATTGTIFTIA